MKYIDLNNSCKDIQDVYHFLQENNIKVCFPNDNSNTLKNKVGFNTNGKWMSITTSIHFGILFLDDENQGSAWFSFKYIYIIHEEYPFETSLCFSNEKIEKHPSVDRKNVPSRVVVPIKNQNQ